MSINRKKINETGVFLDNNLSFKIKVFISGLANDLHIHKKYEKSTKLIIPSNLFEEIIHYIRAVTLQKYYNYINHMNFQRFKTV